MCVNRTVGDGRGCPDTWYLPFVRVLPEKEASVRGYHSFGVEIDIGIRASSRATRSKVLTDQLFAHGLIEDAHEIG